MFVCLGDDDTIAIIDTKTLKEVGELPSGPDPEQLRVSPDGKLVFIANENDALLTAIDIATRKVVSEFPVGVEPEGVAVSPDGSIVVNTSETTSMAHLIDWRNKKIVANILVPARPRYAEYNKDGSELWVSSEVGGTVSVIDPVKHVVTQKITFDVPGLAKELIQPVGIRFSADGKLAFVALGPANRVAVIDAATKQVIEISARRPARLATGAHARRQISFDDQRRFERRIGHRRRRAEGHQIDPRRFVSLGRGDREAMTAVAAAPPKATVSALSVENVSHAYGARIALDDVSFDVAPASFTVLLGLNGAGKSTLFSVITHLYASRSGVDRAFSAATSRARAARRLRCSASCFSSARSIPISPSRRTSPITARLHGIGAPRDARATGRRSSRASVSPIGPTTRCAISPAARCAGSRSRARSCTGRACCCSTSRPPGSTSRRAPTFSSIVRGLVADEGIGVLWATHLVDEVRDDDHVVVLHQGRVLADGACRIVSAAGAALDRRRLHVD